MVKPRYLTKSRFKEGLECITKLYYTGKKEEYANQSLDDSFLKALADGGFQVGELAKYYFCDDPVNDNITVESLDYNEALKITHVKLSAPGKVVIAEAAFCYRDLFIRADIVVKEGKKIKLYEVKAKSYDGDIKDCSSVFLSYRGKANEKLNSKWHAYLYDLAFQKYVISKAFPDHYVEAYLLLVDKKSKATIEGLNQLFQIEKGPLRNKVIVKPGLKKSDLGASILTPVNLDEIIDKIWNTYKVTTKLNNGNMTFEEYVELCADTYKNNHQVFGGISSGCRDCNYQVLPGDATSLKSGLHECWKQKTNYSGELLSKPKTYSIWQGRVDKLIVDGVYLLENIPVEALKAKGYLGHTGPGLDQFQRRVLQVQKTRDKDETYYFDKAGFDAERSTWQWPLHMIDFETSSVALPFYKDASPYQGTAFQFSHHVFHADGRIEHKSQFLHFEKGTYPNLHFIRDLKDALTMDNGTIFRYHNHENSYLRMIYRELGPGLGGISLTEKNELIDFIDCITQQKDDESDGNICGERNMVDLYKIVAKYYYPPSASGKIGLKYVLPAIIKDSGYLRNKYSRKGVYGKALPLKSLNFDDHQWIDSACSNDPYKTLPKIFDGRDRNSFDSLFGDLDDVADGGAALTAYNYLQYGQVSEDQRQSLRDALLRYCELDTMAMVMLLEGLMHLEHRVQQIIC